MMSLHDAQMIRTFVRDLEDIDCLRSDVPDGFLVDQDDEIRVAAWKAALDEAERMVRARLREKGVDA